MSTDAFVECSCGHIMGEVKQICVILGDHSIINFGNKGKYKVVPVLNQLSTTP
jgi:hypothetical protein